MENTDKIRLMSKMRSIASEMAKGKVDALGKMRKFITEECDDFLKVSQLLSKKEFLIVWVASKVLDELWTNFGPESSGFSISKGTPYLVDITLELGEFINGEISVPTVFLLTDAVDNVFELLRTTNDHLRERGPIGDKCVLSMEE